MGYGKMKRFDFSFDGSFRRVWTWIASHSTFSITLSRVVRDKRALGDGCEGDTFLTFLSRDDFARSSRRGTVQSKGEAMRGSENWVNFGSVVLARWCCLFLSESREVGFHTIAHDDYKQGSSS